MKKIIMLFMLLALSLGTFSCGGGGAGSADTPGGEKHGVASVVRLSPSQYIAQTNSFIFLHAQVFDGNGSPVGGTVVTFTNLSDPFGKITSAILRTLHLHKTVGILSTTQARTNGYGMATVKISSTSSGFATIQVEVNKGAGVVRDRKTVFFTSTIGSATPPPPTLTLHVDDGDKVYDEPADFELLKTPNDNQRTIKAVVLDGFGVPLSGASVTFGSDDPGEVTFDRTTVLTGTGDEAGNAYVVVTVNPSVITNLERVINITAGADIDNNGTIDAANMRTLFLDPVTVNSPISVTANPSVVSLDGTSTVSASAMLSTGGPVPDGSTISFTSTNGTDTCGTITPFAQTTDGVATALFTAPSVPPDGGTCTITATIGAATGTAHVTVTTSLMVQPSSQTVNGVIGNPSVTYTIYGGVAPYTVTSNNIAFPANLSGNIFTVPVLPNTIPTNVNYTVRDSEGATVTAALTIQGGTSLAVLPGAVTVDSTAPDTTVNFTIFGGVAPYSVFTNNPAYPLSTSTVNADDPHFSVTVPKGSPSGIVILTVRDSNGTTATATITITAVAAQALRVIPASQTLADPEPDNTATYRIIGGAGGYTAYSGNPGLLGIQSVEGETLTVQVKNKPTTDTTVTITVYDSAGSSVTASLIMDVLPLQQLSVLPSSQTINGAPGGTARYTVFGGVPPYEVFTSDPTLIPVYPAEGIANGGHFDVTVPANTQAKNATFTIRDSAGSTLPATLIITFNSTDFYLLPAGATIPVSSSMTFEIFGGTTPFEIFIDNPVIGIIYDTDIDDRSFTVIGDSTGSVVITIRDADGRQTTATVTVE